MTWCGSPAPGWQFLAPKTVLTFFTFMFMSVVREALFWNLLCTFWKGTFLITNFNWFASIFLGLHLWIWAVTLHQNALVTPPCQRTDKVKCMIENTQLACNFKVSRWKCIIRHLEEFSRCQTQCRHPTTILLSQRLFLQLCFKDSSWLCHLAYSTNVRNHYSVFFLNSK